MTIYLYGLPEVTRNGKTVTDRATRMVHFIPTCKIESGEDTADLMF